MFTLVEMEQVAKLIATEGAKSDQELQVLQAALKTSPLPSQLSELAPIQSRLLPVVDFLLKVDDDIVIWKNIFGL